MARERRPSERERVVRGLLGRLDFEGLWRRYSSRVGGVDRPDLSWEEFFGLLGEAYLEGAYMGRTLGMVHDWELEGLGRFVDRVMLSALVSGLVRERRKLWERELLGIRVFDA